MRVRDLRAALDEIRSIFRSAGTRVQESAIAGVTSAIKARDDADLGPYLRRVEQEAVEAAKPRSHQHARLLTEAGLDESRFLEALRAVGADNRLKKADIQTIAQLYTGSFERRASIEKLLDAIRLHFYTRIYERDAHEIARRARPI